MVLPEKSINPSNSWHRNMESIKSSFLVHGPEGTIGREVISTLPSREEIFSILRLMWKIKYLPCYSLM